ncbi:hypothetical protein ACFV4P_28190 [Kitasatospora sp. NPDC059795]|uniref:hypothetical protein n=1 Tax=Kitasatospora sp. NPDC059795 TaxID=3346949 RepID=UPI003657D920
MDDTGRGAVALAVALRDAHFRLKALVRGWEERLPGRGRQSLGPVWQYADDPDEASYADGWVLELDGGLAVVFQLHIRFGAAGTDLLAEVSVQNEAGDVAELLAVGPEEFPPSAGALAAEIAHCLDHLERLDLSAVPG